MKRILPLYLILLSSSFAASSFGADPTPLLMVTDSRVLTVTNATAGKGVALLGFTLDASQRLRRHADVLIDTDGDGRITFEPAGGITHRATWIAVDVETGRMAFGGAASRAVPYRIPRKAWKTDADGLPVRLEQPKFEVAMLVVRPGQGAWLLHGFEGASGDDDRSRNGRLEQKVEDAVRLGGTHPPAPRHLKTGDVVASVDVLQFELRVAVVE